MNNKTTWPTELATSLEQHWQDLCAAAPDFSSTDEKTKNTMLTVWAQSEFAMLFCTRRSELFLQLWQSQDFQTPHDTQRFHAQLTQQFSDTRDEEDLMRRLRQTRNRVMFRILWRDMQQQASVEETLTALSDLADGMAQQSLNWLYQDQCQKPAGTPVNSAGEPMQMVVLGMGKLGGRELNFSSDIDLIFAYPEAGQTNGRRPTTNERFFMRLGQRLIKVLDAATVDGFVYRVDMRLRPFGDSGSLVTHFAAMESYYEIHGREWERYAMVKARVIAGDQDAGTELLANLRGFIYRRYLDYSAIESMREMKALISREAARRARGDDVKLGPGGIREVEFTVQVFQLTHGGRDKHLRNQSLLPTLAYLGERDLLPDTAVDQLREGYLFLRRTENRLQMIADQQVHQLPTDETGRWRIAHGLGFASWEDFYTELGRYRNHINTHFQAVFGMPEESQENSDLYNLLSTQWSNVVSGDAGESKVLEQVGFPSADNTRKRLISFANERSILALTTQGRQRLDRLMPHLLVSTGDSDEPDIALDRLLSILTRIAGRTVYLSMLADKPAVISQLANLCTASPWIAEYVASHPILLDELINPDDLKSLPQKPGLIQAMLSEFSRIDPDDQELVTDRLRHFKNTHVFRVAAADILEFLPVMKVSDHLTWIAEVTLNQVLQAAWDIMTQKYGEPTCIINGETYKPHFIIIGYGKLGGIEMGYGSDLDMVFLHDSRGEKQLTNGDRSINNATFFARLGQRIVHLLTVFTAAGKLYEVDMRLRPSGNSGMLVASMESFEHYQRTDAWTWEHQALIRTRVVAGPESVAEKFNTIRGNIIAQPRDLSALKKEVVEMREKMWAQIKIPDIGWFDLKKSPGGITDIEFMVQYLVLAHAHQYPQLCDWSDNVRILDTLAGCGVLSQEAAQTLTEAYTQMRDEIHHRTLRGAATEVEIAHFSEQREQVQNMWQQLFV